MKSRIVPKLMPPCEGFRCSPGNQDAIMTETEESRAIRFERLGTVARITLNRPDRHNALGADDVDALRDRLDEIAADGEVRVLVLTGAGERTFSSGASLGEMESGRMSGTVFDTVTDRLAALPLPTIARINGSVYGGGAELALCCDLRVGVRDTRLSVPATRLGICYPLGGLRRYVDRLGLGVASRILLAAEELSSDELLGVGYLTHLVDRDDLDDTVDALAGRLAHLEAHPHGPGAGRARSGRGGGARRRVRRVRGSSRGTRSLARGA